MSRPECDGECIPCTLDGETLHCNTYPPTVPLLLAQVAKLRAEVSALRLRAETAEDRNNRLWAIMNGMGFRMYSEDEGKQQISEFFAEIEAEAYAKGQRDRDEEIIQVTKGLTNEVAALAMRVAIRNLPIKERP